MPDEAIRGHGYWDVLRPPDHPAVRSAMETCRDERRPQFRIVQLSEIASQHPGQRLYAWFYPVVSCRRPGCPVVVCRGLATPRKYHSLSGRERQTLRLLGEGLAPKSIAKTLELSVSTVHTHFRHCRDKLELLDLVQVGAWASTHHDLLAIDNAQ